MVYRQLTRWWVHETDQTRAPVGAEQDFQDPAHGANGEFDGLPTGVGRRQQFFAQHHHAVLFLKLHHQRFVVQTAVAQQRGQGQPHGGFIARQHAHQPQC